MVCSRLFCCKIGVFHYFWCFKARILSKNNASTSKKASKNWAGFLVPLILHIMRKMKNHGQSTFILKECFWIWCHRSLKGVFSKPSGNLIIAPIFCLLSFRLQILGTHVFFFFIKLSKLWARVEKLYSWHFTRVPHLYFATR